MSEPSSSNPITLRIALLSALCQRHGIPVPLRSDYALDCSSSHFAPFYERIFAELLPDGLLPAECARTGHPRRDCDRVQPDLLWRNKIVTCHDLCVCVWRNTYFRICCHHGWFRTHLRIFGCRLLHDCLLLAVHRNADLCRSKSNCRRLRSIPSFERRNAYWRANCSRHCLNQSGTGKPRNFDELVQWSLFRAQH